jgi:hypothetical protein
MWYVIHVMVFWVITSSSDVAGYKHFRESCCLHLQGEVHGSRKGGHKYRQGVYEEVKSVWANRKGGRTVIIVVGKGQGGVLDWAATGRNRMGEESSPCQ